MKRPVTKWIVPIMGFRESSAHETGLEKIWRGLRHLVDSSVFVVTPYEWDEDMRGLISFIQRNSEHRPEIMVIAYSWGCGVGFATLAEEAQDVGIRIRYAVLADPVYRSRLFPTWLPFNPLSISRWIRPTIMIPASVSRVEWVRQVEDFPCGHNLAAEDARATKISIGRYVIAGHREIDDSLHFRVLAEHWARIFAYDLSPEEAGQPECLGLAHRPMNHEEWMEFEPEEIIAPA